jgi:type IV pilus assembly protein PilM
MLRGSQGKRPNKEMPLDLGLWQQRLKGLKRPIQKLISLLQRWKHYTSEQLIGLDIGPGFIKLIKINADESPHVIEGLSVEALPPGVIAKDEIKDPAAIKRALTNVLNESGVNVKNVAFAIPRSSTIIKTIAVDKRLNAADIESRAWIEANHHFPDLVGDIYLDFDVLGPSVQDPSQLDLLLVACRKDHVKPYLDVLNESGLNVKVVDVNCYALQRALVLFMQQLPKLHTVALLNLDYHISSLIVVHNEQMIYAHDHSYEGHYFMSQVQQYLNEKKGLASSADLAYIEILKAGLSAHLRHSMHFFYSSRPHISIEKLVLAGDCSAIPHLNAFIKQETGIETITADPFAGMAINPGIDDKKLHEYASALMLSCGLALSKLKEMES